MKVIACRGCGSVEFEHVEGYSVCTYCQTKYLPEKQEQPSAQSSIELHSDIELLLEKCRMDPANSRRYANLILDIDPHNREAKKHL
jgi:hypothetical protein